MYSVCDASALHQSLAAYLESGAADAIGFDEKHKTYTFKRPDGKSMLFGGLVSKLKQLYYPKYKQSKRRKKTLKKGSDAELGKRIDREIMMMCDTPQGGEHQSFTQNDYTHYQGASRGSRAHSAMLSTTHQNWTT